MILNGNKSLPISSHPPHPRGQPAWSVQAELATDGPVTTLSTLLPDETAEVRALVGGPGLVSRLAALGFVPGARIRVLQTCGGGPLVVLVRDTRVALGHGEAMKVLVARLEGNCGDETA